MKIIFAGTPHFAATALEALLENKLEIVAVLTQPDRPAGRGMKLQPSPVKELALQHGISVFQPLTLKITEIQQQLAKLQADVMIVAAYGLILPQQVLQIPRLGCLNIHASLLPRWRGAAPIQRAILAGDQVTGITIMQMDEGLDTGAMLLKKTCPVDEHDTAKSLHDKLAILGAEAIVETINKIDTSNLKGESQDSTHATYAAKISKSEAELDWRENSKQLELAVRAYNPVPVAHSSLNGTVVKIWQSRATDEGHGDPGEILLVNKDHVQVACGQGSLFIEILQRPGSKALPVAPFIQGFSIKVGDHFSIH